MPLKSHGDITELLHQFTIVLCQPSHPGNIGAAARAMKTMGLINLSLVSPHLIKTPLTDNPPVFNPSDPGSFRLPEESYILSSGARDVLDSAVFYPDLKEALRGTHWVCALTSRQREITSSPLTPKEAIPFLLDAAQRGEKIAFLFGSETFGLSIDEVALANRLITIPGNPDYFSLNLAQAVQVMTYELYSELFHRKPQARACTESPAPREAIFALLMHFENTLNHTAFFANKNKERLMRHIAHMLNKSSLEKDEVDLLRGVLSAIDRALAKTT
ncbi:MAG: RNA methyltransferase [Haemophilus parainfluenzae]|nr:MAG: RNA methyltransferase [Haemophilus parainfluenzae]